MSRGIYQIRHGICQILPRKTVGPTNNRSACKLQRKRTESKDVGLLWSKRIIIANKETTSIIHKPNWLHCMLQMQHSGEGIKSEPRTRIFILPNTATTSKGGSSLPFVNHPSSYTTSSESESEALRRRSSRGQTPHLSVIFRRFLLIPPLIATESGHRTRLL